jgi:hypothetical protein
VVYTPANVVFHRQIAGVSFLSINFDGHAAFDITLNFLPPQATSPRLTLCGQSMGAATRMP